MQAGKHHGGGSVLVAAHSELISFSTRSSTALNGSLQSTVRWAWSFNLRCTQSTVKSRFLALAALMNSPRSRARVVCRRLGHRPLDRLVGDDPFVIPRARGCNTEPSLPADVVIGEVEQRQPREDSGRSCFARYRSMRWYLATQSTSRASDIGSFSSPVSRYSHMATAVRPPAGTPRYASSGSLVRGTPTGRRGRRVRGRWPAAPCVGSGVVGDLADCPNRSSPASGPGRRRRLRASGASARGADLHVRHVLGHVRVAGDHVEPSIPLGIGVGLVARVDDRSAPGGRRRDPFPDVLGPLCQAVDRSPRRLEQLARPGEDLPGDEERDQRVDVR